MQCRDFTNWFARYCWVFLGCFSVNPFALMGVVFLLLLLVIVWMARDILDDDEI
jgi:hypothetical protein